MMFNPELKKFRVHLHSRSPAEPTFHGAIVVNAADPESAITEALRIINRIRDGLGDHDLWTIDKVEELNKPKE